MPVRLSDRNAISSECSRTLHIQECQKPDRMFESTLNIQNQLTISWVWKCYSLVKSGSMIRTIRNVHDGGWQPECVPGRGTQPTTRAKHGQYQRCETHTHMILSGPGTRPKLWRHQAQYKDKRSQACRWCEM